MNTDEVVIISDDKEKDSDIEVIDITKENSTELKSSNNDAILIDGDAQNDNDVIEVIDIDRETNDKHVKEYLNKVCSENRIVGEFIEKCLDLENSSGMLRVIHRTFLPLYFKMDEGRRESDDFKRLLDVKMRALECNPNRKFSHLKTVCEIMKSFHKDRKKVNFVTLTKDVKAKPSQRKPMKPRKRKRSQVRSNVYKKAKRKSENIIEIDDTDDSQTITNNTQISTENSLTESEEIVVLEDDDLPNNSNKENNNQSHNSRTPVQVSNSERNTNQFLVPQRSEDYMMNEKKASQIKDLEKQIEVLKKRIDELEQQEVDLDSHCSPYIICEEMKLKIVNLYKELCTLTGSEAVKKREVRLTGTEGRPHLPVKILEEFINDNIGSDGNPHFPDFTEVVRCVSKANVQAKLGWSQARIMSEARNLFTYCGQALQANRKKREWKYLLSRVDSKLDEDPADNDPALMQRLEVNRCIAVKKESDLLDKYVELEQICDSRISLSFNEDSDNAELMNQITNKEITTQSIHNLHSLTSVNYGNGIDHNGTEVSTSKTIVYGSHQNKSMQEHAMENISDACRMIQQKSYIENDNTSKMLEVAKFIEISVPAMNNITDTIENAKQIDPPSALETKQNGKTVIEVCIENHKPPEVNVINLFDSPVENDANRIKAAVNQVISKGERTEILDDNTNEDDPTIAKGNIVIQDVYSIATKQEITSFQNNDFEKSDIGGTLIEKNIQQTSVSYKNPEENRENIGIQEVNHVTTANNDVTTSNVTAEKTDVVNDDLIQSVKVESSEVLKQMQMFGDSFTATIFDIEDPFLVIEISDSSDDSDCDES